MQFHPCAPASHDWEQFLLHVCRDNGHQTPQVCAHAVYEHPLNGLCAICCIAGSLLMMIKLLLGAQAELVAHLCGECSGGAAPLQSCTDAGDCRSCCKAAQCCHAVL